MKLGELIKKAKNRVEEYNAKAPERRKNKIARLKHQTETLKLKAEQQTYKAKLEKQRAETRKITNARYSGSMGGMSLGSMSIGMKPKEKPKPKEKVNKRRKIVIYD